MALFRGGKALQSLGNAIPEVRRACTQARVYRDRVAVSVTLPAYEEQKKKKPNGLKIVIENRNAYEGQYIRVTHVVYDGPGSKPPSTPQANKARALPGWMGSGSGALPPGRRRSAAKPFGGRLLS